MRARIGQYASKNRIAVVARRFLCELEKPVDESTVREIKRDYLAQVKLKRRAEESMDIWHLPNRKNGRPLLLGNDIDDEVHKYLLKVREWENCGFCYHQC